MIRPVLQRGDKTLTKKCLAIPLTEIGSEPVKQAIDDLFDTMHNAELIAMAAPQIGINLRLFITELRKTKLRNASETDIARVFINPVIISKSSDKTTIFEGCGSVPGDNRIGEVERPREIIVAAYNEKGRRFELRCNGLLARAIQHELDHLEGREFLDAMHPGARLVTYEHFAGKIKDSPEHRLASQITIKESRFL